MKDLVVNFCVAGKKMAHAVFGDIGAGVSSFLTDNFAPPTSVDWQVRVYGDTAKPYGRVCKRIFYGDSARPRKRTQVARVFEIEFVIASKFDERDHMQRGPDANKSEVVDY